MMKRDIITIVEEQYTGGLLWEWRVNIVWYKQKVVPVQLALL